MKINIKSTNLELTPSIKTYIEDKIGSLDKLLGRFELEGDVEVRVEIARTTKHHHSGDVFYAEANLRVPQKLFRAQCESGDIRFSVNKVKEKLHQQIKKHNDVRQD